MTNCSTATVSVSWCTD